MGAGLIALAGALLLADASAHDMLAQAQPRNPFDLGVREASGPPPQTGVAAWILQQQIRFERMLSGAVRAIKTDSSAFWTLLGISFAYGVFHAAGPGHGKAVVASYMLANEQSLRRGLAISFLAAVFQGLVAITIVAVLAALLNATSARMKQAANLVELASYAGVAALGLWLMWRKGRGFIAALGAGAPVAQQAPAPAACGHDHAHGHHAHAHHDHGHHHHEAAKPAGGHAHVHGPDCGHFHAPAPETLGAGFSWKTAAATIFAAGARPCSGAILVLVFALAQGIFLAGVAATFAMSMGTALTTGALAAMAVLAKGLAVRFLGGGEGRGALGVRALEFVAAILVFMLGATLLMGALAGGVSPA
jgi:ABC-type nickel/cobalt efflux system permease component RcnA